MGDLTTGTARFVTVGEDIHSCREHLEEVDKPEVLHADVSFRLFKCRRCGRVIAVDLDLNRIKTDNFYGEEVCYLTKKITI
jgi:hypothetical protein